MTKNKLGTQEKTYNKRVVQIYNFILSHQKLILIIALFIALILPLIAESIYAYLFLVPQTSTRTILEICNSAVNKWVDAFFTFSNDLTTDNDLLGYSLLFVQSGVDRIINFVSDMVYFYQQIFKFNFAVISKTGYILTGIFLVVPVGVGLCMCWMCIKLFYFIESQTSAGKSVKSVLLQLISPRNLFVFLLLFPFPREIILLAAILALFILIYYLILKLDDWRNYEPKQNLFLAISLKKAILFLLFISLLLVTFYGIIDETFTNLTISSFLNQILGLKPNLILTSIIIGIILFMVLWIFVYWYAYKDSYETTQNVARKILSDYWNRKSLFNLVILITIFIPCFDSIVLQSVTRDLTFFLLNLPWIIALMFFDPLQFCGILITAVKVSFDILITSIREIVNDIVPINPSQPSIFGSIQPSLFLTAIIFLVFSIILTLTLTSTRRQIIKDEAWITTLTRHYFLLGIIIPITVISSIIIFILEPTNFLTIYGHQYEIVSDPLVPLIFFGTVIFLAIIFVVLIIWTYIQIYRKGRSAKITLKIIFINSLAVFVAIIMIVPFIWMIKNSLQTNMQNITSAENQGFIPDPLTIANYAQLFGLIPPGYETLEYRVVTWLFNSLVTAVAVTAFLVIFSAMAGYCLAKRDFIGRRALIAITIGIMFVPSYVQVIPLYLELNRLGFVGSLLGVILPFLIQPFSVFLCTAFMRSIPDDYLDAARVDGYSEFHIFWKVVLPLSIPVISVMTIINFIANWNAFMWPLLLLDQSRYAPDVRTLPLGIYKINAELQEQIGVVLALATIIVIPIFIILFLAQDYIKRGVTIEGLKG